MGSLATDVRIAIEAQNPVGEFCAPMKFPERTNWCTVAGLCEAGLPGSKTPATAHWQRTNNASPENSFAPPPGRNSDNFAPTATLQLETRKRLATSAWGETGRVSLHEKKEKNFSEAKLNGRPSETWRPWRPGGSKNFYLSRAHNRSVRRITSLYLRPEAATIPNQFIHHRENIRRQSCGGK